MQDFLLQEKEVGCFQQKSLEESAVRLHPTLPGNEVEEMNWTKMHTLNRSPPGLFVVVAGRKKRWVLRRLCSTGKPRTNLNERNRVRLGCHCRPRLFVLSGKAFCATQAASGLGGGKAKLKLETQRTLMQILLAS
jgi:hypothetical protein